MTDATNTATLPLPDPHGCRSCAHPDCGRFDGPHQVECRAMRNNACAREYYQPGGALAVVKEPDMTMHRTVDVIGGIRLASRDCYAENRPSAANELLEVLGAARELIFAARELDSAQREHDQLSAAMGRASRSLLDMKVKRDLSHQAAEQEYDRLDEAVSRSLKRLLLARRRHAIALSVIAEQFEVADAV
ncbi:hypothetical protein RKE25_22180 (plasmid) [Dyella sp. BiH032]|uniref:hypothetical protein n=1 Tax=Dyella sp. BiH032 TaxID=3075430 RepID=UPI0028932CE6|nr:hypothetical protein [Dyella sp. BiH032]WNL48440.1 hypothetical protein RKE25_22180 [Dyella sp. BiH032]